MILNEQLFTDDLYNGISDALEKYLRQLYAKNNIKTHDVTPEQYLKWDAIVSDAVQLIHELYVCNEKLTNNRYGNRNTTNKNISINKD